MLRAGKVRDATRALVRDARSLARRFARPAEPRAVWSPERLRRTVREQFRDDRILLVANREPYVHEHSEGGVKVRRPPSGLVTALEPVLRACSGTWIAHGGGDADRTVVDAKDHVLVPPGEESYRIRRIWMSEAEEAGYYYGFSNEGLWPLCHLAHVRPVFRQEDFEQYSRINQRFADAVVEEAESTDPIVLVQDYHFALLPLMLRRRLPRATILAFWHIPWPDAERMAICPYREEIISGLLGASAIGFHTQRLCTRFIESVDAFVESRIDRESLAVVRGDSTTFVRAHPISVAWPLPWIDQVPNAAEARASIRAELHLADDVRLGVGVYRLDYTKGIHESLLAVDALLTRSPGLRGKFTFIHVAAPSRTKISRYRELEREVKDLTREINQKWGNGAWQPIVLLYANHDPVSVYRYYRAADVCYVSSLHDGMNLVAKEFVAARDDEQGVLVLSEFAGAAKELTDALIVNPYDVHAASDTLALALEMSSDEQRARMRSMRRVVSEANVYRWAARMLADAVEIRRKERFLGRLESVG